MSLYLFYQTSTKYKQVKSLIRDAPLPIEPTHLFYPGTGEGIYYAMRSGQIAAEVAHRHMASQGNFDLGAEYGSELEKAGLLGLRDVDFIEKNLASPEKAERYVKRLRFMASRA